MINKIVRNLYNIDIGTDTSIDIGTGTGIDMNI